MDAADGPPTPMDAIHPTLSSEPLTGEASTVAHMAPYVTDLSLIHI